MRKIYKLLNLSFIWGHLELIGVHESCDHSIASMCMCF